MTDKINFAMSDQAIAQEIGQRLEQLRLEQNIDQEALAAEVGITPKTYRALIKGQGKFLNIIKVMRVLGVLEQLDYWLPESAFSPMALLKLKGKQRQRASSPRSSGEMERQDVEVLDW